IGRVQCTAQKTTVFTHTAGWSVGTGVRWRQSGELSEQETPTRLLRKNWRRH
ncbi:hypothetical protein LEMLEM_LOCUS13102, partial [Lemmus lemmus]